MARGAGRYPQRWGFADTQIRVYYLGTGQAAARLGLFCLLAVSLESEGGKVGAHHAPYNDNADHPRKYLGKAVSVFAKQSKHT